MLSEKDQAFRVSVRSQIKGDLNSSKKYSSSVCLLSFVCTCAIKYVKGKNECAFKIMNHNIRLFIGQTASFIETNVVSHLSFH